MNVGRTYTAVTIAGIGTLTVALWGAFAWLFISVIAERDSIDALYMERGNLYTRDVHGASVRALARDTRQERSDMSAITDGLDVVDMIGVLEEVSNQARVSTSVDAVSTISTNGPYDSLLMVLRSEGSFADVVHMLMLLESAPVATAIDQFELSSNDTEWKITVRVRVLVDNNKEISL